MNRMSKVILQHTINKMSKSYYNTKQIISQGCEVHILQHRFDNKSRMC